MNILVMAHFTHLVLDEPETHLLVALAQAWLKDKPMQPRGTNAVDDVARDLVARLSH